ncbi:cell wall hydrolase [Pseudomonas sp. TH05]|uniref:cell wall hydrolase n=1 Tax=Pseudomonas sp. TH05 TaxID=2796371 RepID=UPI001911D9D2|nr:cell wall hydrolase [Pseudomonas sp. TH05]MBK5555030.1 cell wall hydrolase [Pseudomonas sp. TH05]
MATFKFPFKDQAGKEVRNADLYYDALTMASSGYYPLGPSGVHCGIHYESAMANTLALVDGIGAIAKGEVVAYRVNRRYLGVRGRATPPMSDKVLYSSGFVLTRHSLEYPAGNKLTYFCLAMHLRSFEEYERLGARAKRPPYWTAKVYRVSEQADDKQDATAGSAATRMTGLRVRAEPSAGTTPILGILPHGARIIGRKIHDRKWVRIQALIEGDMAPLNTGDAAPETSAAIDGWVFLKSLTEQSQVPDAFDEVVFPTPPLKVKAGALLGHLGEYQRIADPGSSRPMLHHEIIVGPDLPAYLHKSRTAAKSAKPEHKTLLRMAPSAQLYNAVLAPAQSGLLSAGTVIELESAPPDDAVYVNVKPAATLQWIDRTAKLPAGAREARLYRHSNTGAYTAADIIAEARRGTAGQAGATGYRGIFVDASDQTPIWIAKNTYRGLPPLGKQKLLLSDVAQGWDSYPLTFAANGHKNGAFPQHFAISTLEQARPATPDPASEPIGFALDEAGKRWWQVQLKDGITSAIGWLGEENHPGISVHSPHEWVDFSVIEAESQTPAYGSYFLTLAEMAAFQRGEKALQKNQLDTPLQEVFDTLDSHPDGALTLGELQAAQRSRSTLQRLSRIILRYPTEWKADPQAWAHYDAEIPPSNRAAWESEKQRMGELVWWDEVAGKINDFPADQLIFHFHIISFISNMKHPDPDELRHLSMTIYGEARGQNYASKIAIAWAIRNRLESSHWGDTYKSVVTARYQFTCWEKNIDPDGYEAIHNPVGEAWKDSKLAAMEVMQAPQSKNVLSGATNYYSPKSQAALHKTDPKRYPSTPAFANPEKRVPNPNGVSNEDYQFYKP